MKTAMPPRLTRRLISSTAALAFATSVGGACNPATQEIADCVPGANGSHSHELTNDQIRRNENPYDNRSRDSSYRSPSGVTSAK